MARKRLINRGVKGTADQILASQGRVTGQPPWGDTPPQIEPPPRPQPYQPDIGTGGPPPGSPVPQRHENPVLQEAIARQRPQEWTPPIPQRRPLPAPPAQGGMRPPVWGAPTPQSDMGMPPQYGIREIIRNFILNELLGGTI